MTILLVGDKGTPSITLFSYIIVMLFSRDFMQSFVVSKNSYFYNTWRCKKEQFLKGVPKLYGV